MNVESNDHSFEAWADVKNISKRDYQIKSTELFGGDVELVQSSGQRTFMLAKHAYASSAPLSMAAPPPPPTIESQGELAGLYFYSINQPFILNQQSTFSLPFVKPTIQLEKYAGLENHFQEQSQKGKFHRKYRIESDRFLPSGVVTVREDGRVVGQVQMCDLAQAEKQDLDCGDDPDILFNRQVKVLQQQRQSASYQIQLSIKNSKSKSVKYEYKEIINSAKFTLKPVNQEQPLDKLIQEIPDGLKIIQPNLQPNQEQTFSYQIDFEYPVDDNQCQYQQYQKY